MKFSAVKIGEESAQILESWKKLFHFKSVDSLIKTIDENDSLKKELLSKCETIIGNYPINNYCKNLLYDKLKEHNFINPHLYRLEDINNNLFKYLISAKKNNTKYYIEIHIDKAFNDTKLFKKRLSNIMNEIIKKYKNNEIIKII